MLIDNILYLKKHYPDLRSYLLEKENETSPFSIKKVETKSGLPTLQLTNKTSDVYLHSKYDPVKEAEQFIKQYEADIEKYDHVLFYGMGLGYHISAFMQKFPKLTVSIYEPDHSIANCFFDIKKIEELPIHKIKHIHIEQSEADRDSFISAFIGVINKRVLLVALPSYQRIFEEKHSQFLTTFKNSTKKTRVSLRTNTAFGKRWTLNSIMNLAQTIKTPNILSNQMRAHFKDKPVVIVSAGPSLNEEIKNLHYIKENKLAYIFSVGSANKTLLKNNIYPDAVCTYDPQGHNDQVFSDLIENDIKTIPMIFGTSVGYETLKHYQGPKLHMLTSQDHISPYYLIEHMRQEDIIFDAPSIAVITLQLLLKLQTGPIILVGQNFAFKHNKFYAEGIQYEKRTTSLSEKELNFAVETTDVHGEKVLTNESFLRMKRTMEKVISSSNNETIINTTNGGAAIKGTTYQPLKTVVEDKLNQPVVESGWYKNYSTIDKNYAAIITQQNSMELSFHEFINTFYELKKIIKVLSEKNNIAYEKEINNLLVKYDKKINHVIKNQFYQVFIVPAIHVVLKITITKIKEVKFEKDILKKTETIVDAMNRFLQEIELTLNVLLPAYEELKNWIAELDLE
ncbi:motility associated factor glycosyltransferase family protein [Amphibacillus jilinensis]|uniref:motility associated factor glycosyltransferase family protein n=1 Tax=Amphibacillus jilinensis TaxID=1216008 RepID=UPI00031F26B9|nr:6-hydroxymethylpterin diphosphokinase MptE-like protein [Amphibacillus jilinensis]